jgi:iron complex outermembrane receptor protein
MSSMSKTQTRRVRRLLAASAITLACPAAAQAQSVNYAELEDMFGEPVTTSVTGSPQRASEAPAALVIVTRDDIRRSPAHDIPGLLQAYAGIDVTRWTAGHADVSIRGGVLPFNPRLLVLVNGRQVYLDHYGMTNWAGLGVQLEEIQQIEIVRGPNSALFGFNAVSGVINIITIDPRHSRQLVTTLEAGTEGLRRVSQSAALRLGDRVGLRLSGGFEETDELDGLGSSALAPQAGSASFNPRHYEAAAELQARLGEGTEASLSATYSNGRHLEVPPVPFVVPTTYEFLSLGARISHDTGWGIVSGQVFQNWSDVHAQSQPTTEVTFHNKVLVASADALVRAGTSNVLRFGLEYRANALRASPGYPGATRYDVYAASAMWEARLNDALTFTAAARVDHLRLERTGIVDQPTIYTAEDFNRSLTALSLNGALLFKLDTASSLRLAGGRGVQAPSLTALGARIDFLLPGLPFPIVITGNPALDPTIIWSGEIGYMRTFGANGTRLELTAFYNRSSDLMSIAGPQTPPLRAPPAFPFILTRAENVGTFLAFGVEAALSGRLGPSLHWMLNYTWTRADQDIEGSSGGQYERPLALDVATPEHKVRVQLNYDRGPWLATVAARYTSGTQQLVTSTGLGNGPLLLVNIEDSVALDARLAFAFSETITLSVTGENLTNASGADLSPVAAERRLRASVRLRF